MIKKEWYKFTSQKGEGLILSNELFEIDIRLYYDEEDCCWGYITYFSCMKPSGSQMISEHWLSGDIDEAKACALIKANTIIDDAISKLIDLKSQIP